MCSLDHGVLLIGMWQKASLVVHFFVIGFKRKNATVYLFHVNYLENSIFKDSKFQCYNQGDSRLSKYTFSTCTLDFHCAVIGRKFCCLSVFLSLNSQLLFDCLSSSLLFCRCSIHFGSIIQSTTKKVS